MGLKCKLTIKGERDYTLVEKILLQHDQQAVTKLFDHYHKSVYFMLFKMTNNSVEAENLTIEAFDKAFHRLKKYNPDYSFSKWLFNIAADNCIEYMRNKNNQRNALNNIDILKSELRYALYVLKKNKSRRKVCT